MFPGFLLNLSLFLSSAGGQLLVGPLSHGYAVPAPPRGEPSLASPFGGRWCPVGTVQRLVSAAASVGDGRSPLGCITRAGRREWTRVSEDGEGSVKPSSRCAAVREKRFAVSLASFQADAHKVKSKVVGLCPTPRNPLKRVDLNFTWLPF